MADSNKSRVIKCVVAGINDAGTPDLYYVKVRALSDEIEAGHHYEIAEGAARDAVFPTSRVVVFDEDDCRESNQFLLQYNIWDAQTTPTRTTLAALPKEQELEVTELVQVMMHDNEPHDSLRICEPIGWIPENKLRGAEFKEDGRWWRDLGKGEFEEYAVLVWTGDRSTIDLDDKKANIVTVQLCDLQIRTIGGQMVKEPVIKKHVVQTYGKLNMRKYAVRRKAEAKSPTPKGWPSSSVVPFEVKFIEVVEVPQLEDQPKSDKVFKASEDPDKFATLQAIGTASGRWQAKVPNQAAMLTEEKEVAKPKLEGMKGSVGQCCSPGLPSVQGPAGHQGEAGEASQGSTGHTGHQGVPGACSRCDSWDSCRKRNICLIREAEKYWSSPDKPSAPGTPPVKGCQGVTGETGMPGKPGSQSDSEQDPMEFFLNVKALRPDVDVNNVQLTGSGISIKEGMDKLGELIKELGGAAGRNTEITEQAVQKLQTIELTGDEKKCLTLLAEAWNAFTTLPAIRESDPREFADAIHRAQYIIASRVARRVNPDVWS